MNKKIPIIIDCDMDVDDALALLILAKNLDKFNLKLIATVAGNVEVNKATNNLVFLSKLFFKKIKLAKGKGGRKDVDAKDVHGKSGLGNLIIKKQTPTSPLENSVEAIHKTLNENITTTIISLGPMTNIANLITKYPEDKSKIKEIYCMIGSVNGIGNIVPYAEFNAYYDATSFKIVSESGIKLIINPVELGLKVSRLSKELINKELNNSKKQKLIKEMINGMFEPDDTNTICLYDPNTICALLKPRYYKFIPCDIKVTDNKTSPGKWKTFISSFKIP